MTKRHFVKIAGIIRLSSGISDRERVASQFADMLKQENPRFDRERFIAACMSK